MDARVEGGSAAKEDSRSTRECAAGGTLRQASHAHAGPGCALATRRHRTWVGCFALRIEPGSGALLAPTWVGVGSASGIEPGSGACTAGACSGYPHQNRVGQHLLIKLVRKARAGTRSRRCRAVSRGLHSGSQHRRKQVATSNGEQRKAFCPTFGTIRDGDVSQRPPPAATGWMDTDDRGNWNLRGD